MSLQISQQAWPAPAKLNLFLHITGRREDGYHLLQSVFQFLDYADTLRFQLRDDGRIRLQHPLPGVAVESDLVVRAARLLQSHCAITQGVDIAVEKILPMGGGLGGGSSDAATTLVALNQLWQCRLDDETLAQLGLSLGADVPVFVRGEAAWAEGVGEQLTPVTLPEPWFVVLCPAVEVATGDVFAASQLRRDCRPITIRDFLADVAVQNVCEPVVRQHYPEVAAALDALNRHAAARMTGTGACVFAAFETQAMAHRAFTALSGNWPGFVARGRNTSPLKRLTTSAS